MDHAMESQSRVGRPKASVLLCSGSRNREKATEISVPEGQEEYRSPLQGEIRKPD